jgi:GTP-binding protein
VKFIDEAIITVQSGDGGAGCISFRRERFIPRGGPDGGDGGKGGDVILQTTSRKRTLYHLQHKRHFKATNGSPGQGNQKTGPNGRDLTIEIPPGTLVKNIETHEIIHDFVEPDELLVVAKGGRGGQGNTRFKSATNRAPRFAQPGEPGQTITLKLELKLLADVGLIGLPNAGKSTLIRAISSAKPKIGDYPFTTLTPHLGVVQTKWAEPFVVADIPGLIEGAHKGAGLGIRFLRHIERTRILVHLVDASALDPDHPLKGYTAINYELERFETNLALKPQLVVLNKIDLPGAQEAAALFQGALDDQEILSISALTGQGIDQMLGRILNMLERFDDN